MDQRAANSTPALELLPIEVKQAIMSTLPDVRSLKSITLTSSSLCQAFTGAKVLITSRVLLNKVEFDVLPEAAAALESSRLEPRTRRRIQDFVFQHLHIRGPPPQAWTLSDALLISKVYDHVHYFAADLASKTLAKPPISTDLKPDQAPLSQNEMTRIMRTFYRFEIYCVSLRKLKSSALDPNPALSAISLFVSSHGVMRPMRPGFARASIRSATPYASAPLRISIPVLSLCV